ncbi:MAG: hypothetical protein ACREQ4_07845 [Candidatus Binataceae bacterium]
MGLSDLIKDKAKEALDEAEGNIQKKVDEVIEQEKQALGQKLNDLTGTTDTAGTKDAAAQTQDDANNSDDSSGNPEK